MASSAHVFFALSPCRLSPRPLNAVIDFGVAGLDG
jgi:hypothetical protein